MYQSMTLIIIDFDNNVRIMITTRLSIRSYIYVYEDAYEDVYNNNNHTV